MLELEWRKFRHREKQRRVKIASEIKERGNQALKDGDLTKAEILYTEALDHERTFWTKQNKFVPIYQ